MFAEIMLITTPTLLRQLVEKELVDLAEWEKDASSIDGLYCPSNRTGSTRMLRVGLRRGPR